MLTRRLIPLWTLMALPALCLILIATAAFSILICSCWILCCSFKRCAGLIGSSFRSSGSGYTPGFNRITKT
ncbi:hypothetical protein [Desulforamulus ruminis]|uniref:hypothetical protein n=1 Tax=Desulforamulus ruminis TaxID=1564 RepID=UPI00235366C6|nr:hypothetical protein [Desulforamulus ruminis]